MGKPNFEWHIGGGDNPRRSGYLNLLMTIYAHAIFEMRKYPVRSREFSDAADFLERDPYGMFSDSMSERILKEIWEKREAYSIFVSRETFFDANGYYESFEYTDGEWINEN